MKKPYRQSKFPALQYWWDLGAGKEVHED